jgi:hypothetical protein
VSTIKITVYIDGVEYGGTLQATGGASGGANPASPGGWTENDLPKLPDEYKTLPMRLRYFNFKIADGKNGKPYIRFWAKNKETGEFLGTFDTRLGALLEDLCTSGQEYQVAYTENDRGKTIVGIQPGAKFPPRVAKVQPRPERKAAPPPAPVEEAAQEATASSDDDESELPF